MSNLRSGAAVVSVAALIAGVAAGAGLAWRVHQDDERAMAAQQASIGRMQGEIEKLSARAAGQPDWTVLAARTEPSVFTISTDEGLGSGWVVTSSASGSDLVTNFHVVAEAIAHGATTVNVIQGDRTLAGTIERVDRTDDLALVHVDARLAPLSLAPDRPRLGAAVMVVGSPLGLGGTISVGLVSGFRSIAGSDYVQFSAPISPGNSGGPVVDVEGRVIGIASDKYAGDGIEALGFAIPVPVACAGLHICKDT